MFKGEGAGDAAMLVVPVHFDARLKRKSGDERERDFLGASVTPAAENAVLIVFSGAVRIAVVGPPQVDREAVNQGNSIELAGITDEGSNVSAKTARTVNSRMDEANRIIKELAASHSMTVIDMAALMNTSGGKLKGEYATPDGVHFSEAGNQLWFDTLRPYVQIYD